MVCDIRYTTLPVHSPLNESEVFTPEFVHRMLSYVDEARLKKLYHFHKRKQSMAKTQVTPETNPAPAVTPAATTPTGKPKRHRSPSIKYEKIIETKFVPKKEGETRSPLDEKIKLEYGGLRFDGVLFESNCLGFAVKHPKSGTILKEPTLRQLMEYLDTLRY